MAGRVRSPVGAGDDGWVGAGDDGREPGMTVKFFDILERKDLRFILNALYLYIIMYMNLRALWLLSVLRNYATI